MYLAPRYIEKYKVRLYSMRNFKQKCLVEYLIKEI